MPRPAMPFVMSSISQAILGAPFVAEWGLFEVSTLARTKAEFLLKPELGRALDEPSQIELASRCPPDADLQVAIADGLSAAAVRAQVPVLLPLLAAEARQSGLAVRPAIFHSPRPRGCSQRHRRDLAPGRRRALDR